MGCHVGTVRISTMNSFEKAVRPAIASLLLAVTVATQAAPTYSVQDLGPIQIPGSRFAHYLNNRGEILYTHRDPASPLGYWLPRPNYGLPAGFNDLAPIRSDIGLTIQTFSDDGFYYGQAILPHAPDASETEWAVQMRGSVQGLSEYAKAIRYVDQGVVDGIARRQRFSSMGIATDGTPWGRVDAMAGPVGGRFDVVHGRPYDSLEGQFRGKVFLPIPGESTFQTCEKGDYYENSWYALSSPNGTFLAWTMDACKRNDVNITSYALTLSVIGPAGSRIIAVQGTDYPAPEVAADSNGMIVSDRGDAAGTDAKGPWFVSADGTIGRLPNGPTLTGVFNSVGWLAYQLGYDPTDKLGLWNGQTAVDIDIPWATLGYPGGFGIAAFNNRGEILGFAKRADDGYVHNVLLTPVMSVGLAASVHRAALGNSFVVTATVTNIGPDTLTSLAPLGTLEYTGKGNVDLVSGPEPAQVPTLPSDGIARFAWTVRATNAGDVKFTVALRATRAVTPVESVPAASEVVHLVDRSGDLLIKSTTDPESAFALSDFLVPTAAGAQLRSIVVKSNQITAFDVRLHNVGKLARTFTLLAIENGGNEVPGWQRSYTSGDQDLTEALASPAGYETPKLPTNGVYNLRISLKPTNAPVGGGFKVALVAADSADATTAMDAVEVDAVETPIPIEIGLRRLTGNALTRESIELGKVRPDAPLEPKADPAVLRVQPEIHGGLVADGVTPLVLDLHADVADLVGRDGPQKFRLRAKTTGGGTLENGEIESRLRVLHGNAWTTDLGFELSDTQPHAWAYIMPVAADDVRLKGSFQLSLKVEAVSDDAGLTLHAAQNIALRHPPIALIHGYNTRGDWGDQVLSTLQEARGGGDIDENDFVRVCRYGIDRGPNLLGTAPAYVNTLYPFRQLVPLAEAAFAAGVAPLKVEWAFTRHDVVAHSQGGLLTRMLCSKRSSQFLDAPYRNEDNFYRGRFHRIVTIGSPHNGSRLLRYLLDLFVRAPNAMSGNLPANIGTVVFLSNIGQEKFDPFGDQIRELNSADPDGPWQPDPAARFHLVRAVINNGHSPTSAEHTPADYALGFALPGTNGPGQAVIPMGSDGVVDFDSMGALAPGQTSGNNVFTYDPGIHISHAPPPDLWDAVAAEGDSIGIATHVVGALDQDPSMPSGDRVFGRFVVPPLLDTNIMAEIDGWAALVVPASNGVGPFVDRIRGGVPADEGDATYRYRLAEVPGYPVAGSIHWSAVVFGDAGVTSDGLIVTVPAGPPGHVMLTVASGVVGDVVLYVGYQAVTGEWVLTVPVLVASQGIVPSDVVGLAVAPDAVSLPVRATVPVQFYSLMNDGRAFRRFVRPEQVQATSTDPAVVDVSDPLVWKAVSPGSATIVTTLAGRKATNHLDVFGTIPAEAPLRLSAIVDGNDVVLSWPTSIPATAQTAATHDAPDWQAAGGTPTTSGDLTVLRVPLGSGERFFRLLRIAPASPVGTPAELLGGVYGWNRSGTGGEWGNPANWDSTAITGVVPTRDGSDYIDITYGASGAPGVGTVDGVFGIRSLTFGPDAPDQHLLSGVAARLDLGAGGLTKANLRDVVVDVPIRLAFDQTWSLAGGTLSVASLDLQGRVLTLTGGGTLSVQALGGTAAGRLSVQGPGRVDAGTGPGKLAFAGTLAIAGGTLYPGLDPLNGAGAIEITGGLISLPANSNLASAAAVRLSGGVVSVNGAGGDLGDLQLLGTTTLNLGPGTAALRFASASVGAGSPKLLVSGWTGTNGSTGTGQKILVIAAPTAALLAGITFNGPGHDAGSMRLAGGEIVPLLKGSPVLPANPWPLTFVYGPGESRSVVAIAGQPFTDAVQLVTTQKPVNLYGAGMTLKTTAAVATNDNLVAHFWIRRLAPEPGTAQVTFNFELASGNFEKSIQSKITLTDGAWHEETVKFKPKASYAAGAAEVSFWAGYGIQTVQIGALEILNYNGVTPP